jgi:arylformamidase
MFKSIGGANGSSRIYDISPVISEKMAVFPGDTPFSREELLNCGNGDSVTLSSMKTTLHIGAHVDAPSHYDPAGETMENRSLHFYMGSCSVIDVSIARGERIKLSDFDNNLLKSPRVLFKTNSYPDPNLWNGDFNSLSVEVIDFIAAKKGLLAGLDTPSVDPADAKDLIAHQAIHRHNMAILEGVVLTDVPQGEYELLAIPLRLKGADASPVRALLLGS